MSPLTFSLEPNSRFSERRGTRCHVLAAMLAVVGLCPVSVSAQQLSATESDPRVLGSMEGFPPPPDKLIMQPDSNFFSFPKLRWTVCHFRELVPTEQVSRGIGAPVPLAYDLDETVIDALTFKPIGSRDKMTWKESLAANYTDGMLIIHEG